MAFGKSLGGDKKIAYGKEFERKLSKSARDKKLLLRNIGCGHLRWHSLKCE